MTNPSPKWSQSGTSFMPASQGEPIPRLPVGIFRLVRQMMAPPILALQAQPKTDTLIVLEDSVTKRVIANTRKFWEAKEAFGLLGLAHKRGILLYGPPGSGKTATLTILVQDILRADGVVLQATQPDEVEGGLAMIRSIEPTRRVGVILEDIDEFMDGDAYGEGGNESILARLLDGENQVDNVVYLATTNYIDEVPDRFKNRPSRFDETVEVGLPSATMRHAYLRAKIPASLCVGDPTLEKWAAETEGFALAHLRELIVGVLALQRPYEEVLERLKKMDALASEPQEQLAKTGPAFPQMLGKIANGGSYPR